MEIFFPDKQKLKNYSFKNKLNTMKKSLLTLATAIVLICTIITQAQAQDDELKVRFGVKGGVNFSNLYTKDVDQNNMLVGFNLGLFAKLPIASFLAGIYAI